MNRQHIEKIYTTDGQFALAVTGGGTSLISDLFRVPGASGTVLEASIPYHQAALSSFLRSRKSHNCSSATARAMAMVAYERACDFGSGKNLFGIGCTSAIATNRERRGADRCHVAVQSAASTMTFDLELNKALNREAQEDLCNEVIASAIARTFGVDDETLPEETTFQETLAPEPWKQLLAGNVSHTGGTDYQIVLPGAFNPMHDGHRGMIEVARQRIDGKLALELSIENVDKPPLDFLTMEERQCDDYDMVFTRAPAFAEKSRIFPGATFIVGLDTIIRIDDPKYYGDSTTIRDAAIKTIAENGNRFLVFGRQQDGRFQTLGDASLTAPLKRICDEVSADEFRLDISSTEIRTGQQP